MGVTIVVGAQGGDEGKGKIVDYLSSEYSVIVRYQGGNNAAHTVMFEQQPHILHLVPSGIFRKHTVVLLGSGMVINPDALEAEIEGLGENKAFVKRVKVSEKAHILFPYHIRLDIRSDEKNGVIDTTHRGIGPAYIDRASREGIRFEDLKYPERLADKLKRIIPRINAMLKFYGGGLCTFEEEYKRCLSWRDWILPMLVEPVSFLHGYLEEDMEILFEGQLGVLRDLDLGTYPYVTSSSPTAAYACAVSGIPLGSVNRIVGVARAYPILVGNGPFPTEMEADTASILRGTGKNPDDEYGGTTGRKRRIGWLDLPALKYSAQINGYTELMLCKLDKLDGFSQINICTHYLLDGRLIDYMPDSVALEQVVPCYQTVPGWLQPTRTVRSISDLPKNAKRYVQLIEDNLQVPVTGVGVGPDREEIAV